MDKFKNRIIIIEDDDANAKLVERQFNNTGDETLIFDTAQKAIDTIIAQNIKAQLIICDYNLPGLNGIELISELQNKAINIPVIMMTAVGNENIAASAIKSGALDYIAKNEGYEENLPKLAQTAITNHKLKVSLAEANREKEEFLHIVSHDLRAPISFCKTALDLIQDEHEKLSERQTDLIGRINQQLENSLELIRTVLDVAAIEAKGLILNYENLSLNKILNQSMEIAFSKGTSYKTYNITSTGFDREYIISGDHSRLQQVFINIMANARKHVKEDGNIKIEIIYKKPDVIVSILNTGKGVPRDKYKYIFRKYTQLKDNNNIACSGLGLGLFIAKKIIKKHEGKIWVESDEKTYTEFYISLPCMEVI